MIYHEPVLLRESIEGLNIKPEGIYVDATFGGGGHSKEILKKLSTGKLVAFDQDEDAEKNKPEDNHLIFVRHNFRYIKNFLQYYKIQKVDGILADLGVSSHQFDEPERGFSFRNNAALDMRMNRESEKSAKTILNSYSEDKLAEIFKNFGELPESRKIARLIIKYRQEKQIETIANLVEAIEPCVPKKFENKFFAQVFQAIRIEVNDELESLKEFIKQSSECLNVGGRFVTITYHSLEDRLVKNFIKSGNFDGKLDKDFYGNVKTPLKAVNKNIITPSEIELNRNNRSRSAKLRIAEKLENSN